MYMKVYCKIRYEKKWSQLHLTIVNVNCITSTVHLFFFPRNGYHTNGLSTAKSNRPNEANKNSWTIHFLIFSVVDLSFPVIEQLVGRCLRLSVFWFDFRFSSIHIFTTQNSHHLISRYNNSFFYSSFYLRIYMKSDVDCMWWGCGYVYVKWYDDDSSLRSRCI